MKAGIYSIPFEDYTAVEATSNTALGKFAICPARYLHWKQNPDEEPSPALKLGRLAHRAILEPEKFNGEFVSTYTLKPETYLDKKTNEEKKWNGNAGPCKEWIKTAEDNGLEIISRAEWDFLSGAAKSIAEHPTAAAMLHSGSPEQSIFADYNGIPVKARVDFLTNGDTLVDLKTTADASPRWFERDILSLAYYRQAAFYLDCAKAVGLPAKHFCLLAVEKSEPYLVACYQIHKDYIEIGRREYIRLLGQLVECQKSGKFPGYSNELIIARPPEWKMRELPVQDPAWMTDAA